MNSLNMISLNSTALVDSAGEMLAPPSRTATGARDQRLLQLGMRLTF